MVAPMNRLFQAGFENIIGKIRTLSGFNDGQDLGFCR
jgi:hypothetical protein